MAYEYRPNGGSLFRNTDMRPDKKDPDLTGKIMLPDGQLHWFKGWKKQTAAGDEWISVQIGNQVQGQAAQSQSAVPPLDAHSRAKGNGYQPQPAPSLTELDDDIPF